MKADLIVHNAAQLLTCASGGKAKKGAAMRDLGIVRDGAIAVCGGKICGVGKSADVLREFESENVFDAKNKVVAPAFVECHTHIIFAGNRLDEFELKIKGADYLEILESGGGILSTVKETRAASLENLVEDARRRLDKMLDFGIGTCEIKTGYGLDTETELKMLSAIFELGKTHAIDLIPTFLPAHAVPPEYKENSDEYVELICKEMLPRASILFGFNKIDIDKLRSKKTENRSGVSFNIYPMSESLWFPVFQNNPFFVDVFCEKNAFNLAQSRRILEAAKIFGFKLKAHVDEFTNLGGAQMAIELGATSVDHLDKISDEEIKLLANSQTIGVITPAVNFNFGSTEFADARKLIDAGCAVAVSTDYNPGSAPCPSLPLALAIACRYQKLLPSEAFSAATINAAFAVASGEKIGSLEAGKQADIVIFDCRDFREVVYEFGANPVEIVFKNGKRVK